MSLFSSLPASLFVPLALVFMSVNQNVPVSHFSSTTASFFVPWATIVELILENVQMVTIIGSRGSHGKPILKGESLANPNADEKGLGSSGRPGQA
jgi:hypothetical protein